MRSPFLYFADERLSAAELCSARLDGHVVEVGEAYMPADAIETTALRAGSLVPLTRGRFVVARLSAAWVYGVIDAPPRRHALARTAGARLSEPIHARVRFHDIPVAADDICDVAGVAVTSPVRTVVDLARLIPTDPSVRGIIATFFDVGLAAASECIAWMEARVRLPDSRAAVRLLRELSPAPDASQLDVTR